MIDNPNEKISEFTVRRLSNYFRILNDLEKRGIATVSSARLAELGNITSAQVRKDLSYFGAFGKRGIGYPVASTAKQIRGILKLDVTQKAALLGAGRLGAAIAEYPGFAMFGFDIAAIFDNDKSKIGTKIGNITVEDVARIDTIQSRDIHLSILAVPAEAAQSIADQLVQYGIKGILNLSPSYVEVPKRVKVVTIDLAMALGTLPYYM